MDSFGLTFTEENTRYFTISLPVVVSILANLVEDHSNSTFDDQDQLVIRTIKRGLYNDTTEELRGMILEIKEDKGLLYTLIAAIVCIVDLDPGWVQWYADPNP